MVIVIGGVGFIRLLTNLFQEGMVLAFNTVPHSENFVLDENYHKYTTPFEGEMKDKFKNVEGFNEMMKILEKFRILTIMNVQNIHRQQKCNAKT